MTMIITLRDICLFISAIILLYIMYEFFNKIIFPWIVDKRTIDLDTNPKWIVPELQNKYYGFKDMDIIIVNSPLGLVPRFRLAKGSKNRLQLLIPDSISTNDIDNIAQIALAGKLRIIHGLWFPNKPAYWLSILNYMLDGGDIKIEATKWEDTNNRQETN